MSKKIHQDVIIGLIIILISLFLYIRTYDFIGEAAQFPRGLIFLLVFFSAIIIWGGIKKTKLIKQGEEIRYEGEEAKLTIPLLKSPMGTLLLVTVYVGLLTLIGFFPATFLFVIGFLWYMGVKNWKVQLFTSLGLNLFIYLLFVLQLNVQLPAGIFFE